MREEGEGWRRKRKGGGSTPDTPAKISPALSENSVRSNAEQVEGRMEFPPGLSRTTSLLFVHPAQFFLHFSFHIFEEHKAAFLNTRTHTLKEVK